MRKYNFLIAAIFHVIVIILIVFFASHEGILGKKMQTLSVVLVPKSKTEEVAKPKMEQPRIETPQVAVPTKQPQAAPQTVQSPSPSAAPAVAPPPAEMPSINFSDGAKEVQTITDPIQLYKAYLESYIKSQWNTPQSDYETFVEISITPEGKISQAEIISNNGDANWTKSINDALTKVKVLSRPIPKGFPPRFQIRFDTAIAM